MPPQLVFVSVALCSWLVIDVVTAQCCFPSVTEVSKFVFENDKRLYELVDFKLGMDIQTWNPKQKFPSNISDFKNEICYEFDDDGKCSTYPLATKGLWTECLTGKPFHRGFLGDPADKFEVEHYALKNQEESLEVIVFNQQRSTGKECIPIMIPLKHAGALYQTDYVTMEGNTGLADFDLAEMVKVCPKLQDSAKNGTG